MGWISIGKSGCDSWLIPIMLSTTFASIAIVDEGELESLIKAFASRLTTHLQSGNRLPPTFRTIKDRHLKAICLEPTIWQLF
jgi:hypothetical protein